MQLDIILTAEKSYFGGKELRSYYKIEFRFLPPGETARINITAAFASNAKEANLVGRGFRGCF